MNHGTTTSDCTTAGGDYVAAVARALGAETVRGWDGVTFDAVITLPTGFRHYSGRNVVVAWNHHFGWALGIEGHSPESVLIIESLGLGRTPRPARCTDRVDETIAELRRLDLAVPDTFPVPVRIPRLPREHVPQNLRTRHGPTIAMVDAPYRRPCADL